MEPEEHLRHVGRVAIRVRRARPEDRRLRRAPGNARRRRERLLGALRLRDEIGQLEYKVWYFASLWYDQDQRDNQINARRQQVQILFAKAAQASAWFDPELLEDSPGRGSGMDGGAARSSRSIASRSRISIASRSTCSTTRASTCCRCRAGSRRRRTTPMPRCRPPTSSTRRCACRRAPRPRSPTDSTVRSWRRTATRPTGPRRFTSSTRSTTTPSTPTRRFTTASCSATCSIRRRAATRTRSKRRFTATTSRPRSSKT